MVKRTHGIAGKKSGGGRQMAFDDLFSVVGNTVLANAVAKPVKKASPVPSAIRLVAQHVTRDTFSMPSSDYGLIEQLRVRAALEGRNTNKSEVIRAGLRGLLALEPADLVAILNRLEKVKPGRK
jgi:Arc/MetJ-type ribon-helix-helix transcriptional regulator